MEEMKNQDMIALLLAHRSVREFTAQPAYTIIRVTDADKRAALVAYAGGQEWVRKAPLVLLFCADLHRLDVLVKPEDKNVLHNTELYTVCVIDAALAAHR